MSVLSWMWLWKNWETVVKDQETLKTRIYEVKEKMLTIVERFFAEFEKGGIKSMICYNEFMKKNDWKASEQVKNSKVD